MEFKKEKNWTDLKMVWQGNYKLREKLRDLEDQSHQDNIDIDRLDKYKNEELLIETFSNLQNHSQTTSD